MTLKNSKSIYQGKIISLAVEDHQLLDGSVYPFEVIHHQAAAAVVPVDGGDIILIHQYRPAIRQYIWEIPAGILEAGETPLECVSREIVEEIGYEGEDFQKIAAVFTGAGFCDEVIHIFECRLGKEVGINHEGSEVIEVHRFSREQVNKMLQAGEIQDAKTLIGLMHY